MAVEVRRWVFLLSGLVCFGVGIALMVRGELGLSPWEVLSQGISDSTGIAIGTVSILLGLPIMLAWIPLGERPGIGTLINIVLIGIVTNMTLAMIEPLGSVTIKMAFMVSGVLVIGVGSGLYLSSNMGAGPRDGLMIGLARKTTWPVRRVRTIIEVSVLVVGVILGGTVGIGTVVFAFGIGPVVQGALRVFGRQTQPPSTAAQPV